jgi:geranylgeranyl pyrophosphate synthase
MRYVALGGGKRFRAALVYAVGEGLGARTEDMDLPASAVELIHSFSLVHDDLPAMDDDEVRRGKPSCHVAFDEATAILTGDALQSLAFDILASDSKKYSFELRLEMIQILAKATGGLGMAGGQAIDLSANSALFSETLLETMHQMKTGALIAASIQLGALAAGVNEPDLLAALQDYGLTLGLAYQITDDILDDTSETTVLGKTRGSDRRNDKPTFLTVLGESTARIAAMKHKEVALTKLSSLPLNTKTLLELTEFVTNRHN